MNREKVDEDALPRLYLARGSVITLLLLSHFVVVCALRPILVPWRCGVVCILAFLQTVAGGLAVANVIFQHQQQIELATDSVGVVGTVLGTLMTITDYIVVIKEGWPTIKFALSRFRYSLVAFLAPRGSFCPRDDISTSLTAAAENYWSDIELATVDESVQNTIVNSEGDDAEQIVSAETMSAQDAADEPPRSITPPTEEEKEDLIVAEILYDLRRFEAIQSLSSQAQEKDE